MDVFLVKGNRWEVLGYSYKIKIGWCYSLGLSSATDLERKCSTWKNSAILNVIIEGNVFPAEALSLTQKNVSESELQPDLWWNAPITNWATRTQMAGRECCNVHWFVHVTYILLVEQMNEFNECAMF